MRILIMVALLAFPADALVAQMRPDVRPDCTPPRRCDLAWSRSTAVQRSDVGVQQDRTRECMSRASKVLTPLLTTGIGAVVGYIGSIAASLIALEEDNKPLYISAATGLVAGLLIVVNAETCPKERPTSPSSSLRFP